MTVDYDGKGLFTTGLRHGDALHAGRFISSRHGIQIFGVHENEGDNEIARCTPTIAMFDGATGEKHLARWLRTGCRAWSGCRY